MRGRISDQDLTDYALNELQPEERLYLESILAVSEECREDIYQMIELSEMLGASFESDEEKAPVLALTDSQRESLVQFQPAIPFWECAAAVVGLAASTVFVLTHPAFWQIGDPAGKAAQVSNQMSKIVAAAVAPDRVNFAAPLANIAAFAEDSASWLPTASEVFDPMVCTPPSWTDAKSSSASVDPAP
jgi:anti-sigma factor RsiW